MQELEQYNIVGVSQGPL